MFVVQLSNMRLAGSLPSGFGRGKGSRGEEALSGGRLSRRAADPAVEAERRAQQERHYALDAGKVERGPNQTLMHILCNHLGENDFARGPHPAICLSMTKLAKCALWKVLMVFTAM